MPHLLEGGGDLADGLLHVYVPKQSKHTCPVSHVICEEPSTCLKGKGAWPAARREPRPARRPVWWGSVPLSMGARCVASPPFCIGESCSSRGAMQLELTKCSYSNLRKAILSSHTTDVPNVWLANANGHVNMSTEAGA